MDAKIFVCDHHQCNRRFSKIIQLQNHKMKCHLTIKYQCSFCDRGFREKRKQIYHERTHLNDRKERCPFCKKTFCDPSTLRQHIHNIHDNVPKPYLCKKCGKRFAKLSLLQIHWKTHLVSVQQRKLYECEYCNSSFTTKSNRNKHLKKYHIRTQ
eukprot:1060247_1